jgi:hypothetical protein
MSSVSLDSLQSMALLLRNSYMGHVLLLLLAVSLLKFVLATWRCDAAATAGRPACSPRGSLTR